ncbi:hypothetical protein D3C81_1884700 [compost metagenome]
MFRQIRNQQLITDIKTADVHIKVGGQLVRQSSNIQLIQLHLLDAAILHAGRIAGEVESNLRIQLRLHVNLMQVNMQQLT